MTQMSESAPESAPATLLALFKESIFSALTETFESVQGVYLDKGTSLFETLAGIDAATASIPVSARCASLAAQVEHTRYYVYVLEQFMQGTLVGEPDWAAAWQIVTVTEAEWAASIASLQASYQRLRTYMRSLDSWEGRWEVGGAMAIVVHTAYHLGEIRQALCTRQK
jgi:hypothetical protein